MILLSTCNTLLYQVGENVSRIFTEKKLVIRKIETIADLCERENQVYKVQCCSALISIILMTVARKLSLLKLK